MVFSENFVVSIVTKQRKHNSRVFFLSGQFISAGGDGYEVGGPGTVYLEKLPPSPDVTFLDAATEEGRVHHASNVTEPATNRTLYINNLGRKGRSPTRNLTQYYQDVTMVRACNYSWFMRVAKSIEKFVYFFLSSCFCPCSLFAKMLSCNNGHNTPKSIFSIVVFEI